MSARDLLLPFRGARWQDVQPRHAVLPGLDADVLLHAGPPYASGDTVPAAVRNAAALALVHDAREPDFAAGLSALAAGRYRWAPAQDHGVVTPLAQVVTAGMPLLVVGDAHAVRYAPIAEAPAPALRFGSPHASCVDNLRQQSTWALATLGPCLRAAPLALDAVIAQALAQGDECHARTGAAHAALLARLPSLPTDYRHSLSGNPGFVLTAIMAAAAWALTRGAGELAAIGGNGVDFGIRGRGAADWLCMPASAPVGTRLPVAPDEVVLGAIGDSAVIDACGLGGQALACAPALSEEWRAVLPADWADRPARLLGPDGIVDPARVAASGCAPLIHLAMVGAGPDAGLLGRGFYAPAAELFARLPRRMAA